MDIQSLRYFSCVAKHENISRAAKELNISQPALSRTIKSLEESEGVELFERKGNSIKLNAFGEILLKRSKEIFELENKIHQELYDRKKLNDLPVRLVIRCLENIFPSIIKRFKMMYPNAKISILQNDDMAIIDRSFDLMISGNRSYMDDYKRVKLLEERILCAIPNNHEYANKYYLSIEEFTTLPQIQIGGNRYIQFTILEYFKSMGIDINPSIVCDDVYTAFKFVIMGYGMLIIPEYAVPNEFRDKIKLLPIKDHNFHRDVFLFWDKNTYLSEHAKGFKNLVIRLKNENLLEDI